MHDPRIRRAAVTLAAAPLFGAPALAQECTTYVSEAGSGRVATLERPARDLGNIAADLEPGDVVCITGGTFNDRADSGADRITVPVEVSGGFAPDFSRREPWGAHVTLLTGVHNAQDFTTDPRLTIDTSDFATRLMQARGEPSEHTVVVDGVIIDHGPRNDDPDETGSRIIRQGTPSHTPTPEAGGLRIRTGVDSTVVVRHVIVTNTAPTQGAFAFFPGAAADVNSLIAGNAEDGVWVDGSSALEMHTSQVVGNRVGVFVSVFGSGEALATLVGNAFVDNQQAGVVLSAGGRADLQGNTIARSPVGVFLADAWVAQGSENVFAEVGEQTQDVR